MLKYIDSHCHLQHCTENTDYINLVKSLCGQLAYVVDISTNNTEILNKISLLSRGFGGSEQPDKVPENLLTSFGLYPDQAEKFNREMDEEFNILIKKMRPSAIGEVGLDYYWNYGDKILLEKLFRNQIEMSINMDVPLIVHSRNAFQDTLRILSEYKFNKTVIIHCFGYGQKEAERFLNLGFTLSFAGNLTYRNANDIQNAALIVPLQNLLLETDSPYLSPIPVRGRKNTPLNVIYTYKFLANLKNDEEENLAAQIEKNFKRIFQLT